MNLPANPAVRAPMMPSGTPLRSASGSMTSRVLTGGRVSRVDYLKSQPRKPGEASFFYADHHFSV